MTPERIAGIWWRPCPQDGRGLASQLSETNSTLWEGKVDLHRRKMVMNFTCMLGVAGLCLKAHDSHGSFDGYQI